MSDTNINSKKITKPDYKIHEPIKLRWSPYSYIPQPVTTEDLRSIFEAARWAASSFNDQPWYYIVATRDNSQEFEKLLSCLADFNQEWARYASALALGVIRKKFSHKDKPNKFALHDLGQASANLCVEATTRGISVHQMGGIKPERAMEVYGIPDDYEVKTGIAIGYAGKNDELPEEIAKRDKQSRNRRPLNETVFGGSWAESHGLFK
jgi:nitroreductase